MPGEASRRNLARVHARRGITAHDALLLKRAIYTWYFTPEEDRQPTSRRQLANLVGCSHYQRRNQTGDRRLRSSLC